MFFDGRITQFYSSPKIKKQNEWAAKLTFSSLFFYGMKLEVIVENLFPTFDVKFNMTIAEYNGLINLQLTEEDDTQMKFASILIVVITLILKAILNWNLALIVILLLISILSMSWAFSRAKKLNRNKYIWSFFAFVFPPITLFILGLMNFKIRNKEIFKIVIEYRETLLQSKEMKFDKLYVGKLSTEMQKDIENKLFELGIFPENDLQSDEGSTFALFLGRKVISNQNNTNTLIVGHITITLILVALLVVLLLFLLS